MTLLICHWKKLAAIPQVISWDAFLWMKKYCILIRISQRFVPKAPIDNKINHHWVRWWLGGEYQTSHYLNQSQIAKFMGPTWGPSGSCRPQMGPILAPWKLAIRDAEPICWCIYVGLGGVELNVINSVGPNYKISVSHIAWWKLNLTQNLKLKWILFQSPVYHWYNGRMLISTISTFSISTLHWFYCLS